MNNTGADSRAYTVTIISSPAGTPVSGSTNTFNYPILSTVTLTCDVISNDGSSFTVTSYQWNTKGCYTNSKFTSSKPQCFPHGRKAQIVTGNNLNAEDAGTITCTANINGIKYTSDPFTLHISGEQLLYCVIACSTYVLKQYIVHIITCYILLLLRMYTSLCI